MRWPLSWWGWWAKNLNPRVAPFYQMTWTVIQLSFGSWTIFQQNLSVVYESIWKFCTFLRWVTPIAILFCQLAWTQIHTFTHTYTHTHLTSMLNVSLLWDCTQFVFVPKITCQWMNHYDFSILKHIVDSLTSLFALNVEEILPPTETIHLFLSHINCIIANVNRENFTLKQNLYCLLNILWVGKSKT